MSYNPWSLESGHEPGGGAQARCQATSSITDRSLFFFDARSGADLGSFVLPRAQTATENCTWHNYNPATAGARKLGHLNPQTQEFTIP